MPEPMSDFELEQAIARMRPSHKAWFNHLVQDPGQNATEAAIAAGLGKSRSSSSTLGSRLRTKYSYLIDAYNLRKQQAAYMTPAQVIERLSAIARGEVRVDAQVMKALELLSRIHGMLSDLKVDIDASSLRQALGSMLGAMREVEQRGAKSALGQDIVEAEPAKLLPEGSSEQS